ncbi:MAG: MFS transporter [Acidiferrobacterales bacterium]|nr:MFS transporter [Acidiferrobacterales bacterium]
MQKFYLTIAAICIAHVLGMVPFAIYPTLIPILQAEWSASNTAIGWVAGIYFGGYLVTVIIVVPLTDRVDARKVYLLSMGLTAIAPVAFAFGTFGVGSASVWRFVQGVALAGTYMPGLKAMVDAVPDRMQSRTVAVYTMCFGLGVAVSFLIAGVLAATMTWRWVFVASAAGPLLALCLAWLFLPAAVPKETNGKFTLLPDFRPVISNRKTLGFSIAYGVHNVELFVFRSWAVAFLFFAMTQREAGWLGSGWNPAIIVACATLVAQPFSVITNELADRLNREKVITWVMALSATTGVALGFSSQMSMLVIVTIAGLYAIMTIADSASITSAVIKNADYSVRGTTMALHTLIGFVGAFAGPILFGAVLDLAGGDQRPTAWGLAFTAVGIAVIIGPLAIRRTARTH